MRSVYEKTYAIDLTGALTYGGMLKDGVNGVDEIP